MCSPVKNMINGRCIFKGAAISDLTQVINREACIILDWLGTKDKKNAERNKS